MGDFLFIVSRTEPKRYLRLKQAFAGQTEDVVLDRRTAGRKDRERDRRDRERSDPADQQIDARGARLSVDRLFTIWGLEPAAKKRRLSA